MGANPLVVLPCHRVVGSSEDLAGVCSGGLAAKEYLLELEARESAEDSVARAV